MNRLADVVLAAAVAVLLVAAPGSSAAKDTARDEKELLQIERNWTQVWVTKDAATLGKILGDDWVGQGPLGTMTKAQVLGDLKTGDATVESITLGDMTVRVFGDTAVVMGSNDEKSSYKGKDTSGRYSWTDVFVKRKGKWQAVASQSTLLPPTK